MSLSGSVNLQLLVRELPGAPHTFLIDKRGRFCFGGSSVSTDIAGVETFHSMWDLLRTDLPIDQASCDDTPLGPY
jgi:hypothetical protein